MKLYGSLTSPFVRAVRIAAIELGLDGEIDFAPTVVRPTQPNRDYGAGVNPLRRVPALEARDGAVIVDSRVIIEYLATLAKGAVIPADPAARIDAFNRHAVMSGATEALVSAMYESKMRPEAKRWPEWRADQVDKAGAALDWAESRVGQFRRDFDIGAIGLVCLLGYASFRFAEIDWLKSRSGLAAFVEDAARRRSVFETGPVE
jgi:glutathione S-transferase